MTVVASLGRPLGYKFAVFLVSESPNHSDGMPAACVPVLDRLARGFVEGGYQGFDVQVGGGKSVHLDLRARGARSATTLGWATAHYAGDPCGRRPGAEALERRAQPTRASP